VCKPLVDNPKFLLCAISPSEKKETFVVFIWFCVMQEGSIPTHFRYMKSEFGEYLNKAVQLKVNLKSTAH